MYEHIALGYRSSLALCLSPLSEQSIFRPYVWPYVWPYVRAVDIQIMSEYDQTFGPKLLIGHCDLF